MIPTLITAIVVLLGLCLLGWVAYSLYNDLQTKKNPFGIAAGIIIFAVGVVAICWIASSCKGFGLGNSSPPTVTVSSVPAQPTPHESAVQKQLEQEMRDTHRRQMALSDAQAAALQADREHIAKQREQELKAEKLASRIASFERFAKIGESQVKLLEQISKQKPPVVTNHVVFHAPPTTNIVNVSPSTATITVQAPAVTNIVNVAPAATPPVTIQNVVTNVTVVQPAPVTVMPPMVFTLTNITTGTLTAQTQSVVAPTPKPAAPAPAVTKAPPAPKAPVKVKSSKAPVAPVAALTNAAPAKAVAAKAPPAKAGRGVVTHTEDPGKISRGAKDWPLVRWFTTTPETVQRKFALEYTRGSAEDQALAQKALDLFIAHQAKELRKEAVPKNLLGMFTEFVNKNTGLKLGAILGMNPVITSEILPGGTPGT